MLFKQIRYFITVIDEGSFTAAAEKLYLSQSAISQQIRALEEELGTDLLVREKRTFTITPAGEYFYHRGKALLGETEAIKQETFRIGTGKNDHLRIGYLNILDGSALDHAISAFSEYYPDVSISVTSGTHEELYRGLEKHELDIALNDQRRAFSEEYVNMELIQPPVLIEISRRHYLADLERVEIEDLHTLPCILLSQKEHEPVEAQHYRDILGFPSDFIFAKGLDEARLMVAGVQGFLPIEDIGELPPLYSDVKRIPVLRHGAPLRRRYCAFWRKTRGNEFVETFADLLQQQFARQIGS